MVSNYLSTASGLPLFYVVGDSEYAATLDEMQQAGLGVIRVSDFCKKPDKIPSIDDIIDSFRTADVDYKSNKYVLIGLGEYLALRGEAETMKILRELKNTTLGIAKVIILLRFIHRQAITIIDEDIRLKSQRAYISGGQSIGATVVNVMVPHDMGLVKGEGLQLLLRNFESGATGTVYAKTSLNLFDSLLPIESISDSYSAIKILVRDFNLPKTLGEGEYWDKLLRELQRKDYSLRKLFESYGLDQDIETDYIERAFGLEYKNWLYFIALKYNVGKISNPYLRFVITKTEDLQSLKKNTLNAIIDVYHLDKEFSSLYRARKKLLRGLSESDVAIFVRENEIDTKESIYKYTDNTIMERQAIIQWIAEYGLIPEVDYIFPALASYLKRYVFDCGKISTQLTDYFTKYKLQKIQNKLDIEFEDKVRENSSLYAYLDTRSNAIAAISDKKSCYLYWIDALGVEYLSYIQDLAKEKGLSLHVDIVRADLPTITSINKSFFDEWDGGEKYKQSALDDIKHKEKGGFDFQKCQAPIHLANELAIIEDALNRAALELAMRTCKKFIIASDHGASRLAVLSHHEEKYETDTKGEHSGRCCKYFDGYDIENSVAENGFVILTDYGRFKGSRAANVEVHGGATLEETVIPIITLSLKNQSEVDIRVLDANNIIVDRKNGITVNIYISEVEFTTNVKIVIKGNPYTAERIDKTHYRVLLPDIRRSGKYSAEVFDGENLIGNITINAKGAIGSTKSDFDDLF